MSASAHPDLQFPKRGQIKLTGKAYANLRQKVFRLDGYKCRVCGSISNLTPHHMIRRSKIRLDIIENLLSLCLRCNQLEADRLIIISWIDSAKRTIQVQQKYAEY